jgi:hypothetical protein
MILQVYCEYVMAVEERLTAHCTRPFTRSAFTRSTSFRGKSSTGKRAGECGVMRGKENEANKPNKIKNFGIWDIEKY